jgi:predicted nucleic acid-binding protein
MSARPFFDTNVLIYSATEGDPRTKVAEDLLYAGGMVSVQVLNEFVAAARRKFKMSWQEIEKALAAFRALCPGPVAITLKTHEAAIKIATRYGYGIYDSLVIAAAQEASCDVLYSEDMQSGHQIEGLTIHNPFIK